MKLKEASRPLAIELARADFEEAKERMLLKSKFGLSVTVAEWREVLDKYRALNDLKEGR